MGPYCKFCDNRCFTHFPDATPQYILVAYKTNNIIATCRGGQDFEMGRIGYSYDEILKHIEIVASNTCAVCKQSLDTPVAPIAENDGYGKTIYSHPDCHPENQGNDADNDEYDWQDPNQNPFLLTGRELERAVAKKIAND